MRLDALARETPLIDIQVFNKEKLFPLVMNARRIILNQGMLPFMGTGKPPSIVAAVFAEEKESPKERN